MRKKLLGLFSIIFTIVLLVSCTGKTFEVDFDLNGGTVAEAIEVQKIKKEGLVTKPTENPTKEGYTFTFWAQESGDEWKFQEDKVTEATTLYAQWEINEYNVTFDVKGGTPAPEAQVVEFGEKATKPADPTAVGKVFLGWFEAEAAEAYDFDKTVSKDLALEARWSDLNVYTVTFDAKSEQANPSDIKLFDGEVATKPANPTKAGHTFLGWFEDGATAVYDFSKPVTKNIDLVARWEIHTFEVTFDVDGEKSSEELNYNEKVAEPDEPTKAGYDFVGWYLEDALYNFDTPVTEDIVLVAKWEIQVYAVKFDSSGGSAVANQNIKYNEKVVKPANPTRENYNFMGWYLANAEYDFDTPVTKAITLVAKWEIYKYDVEFDVDGGTPAIAKQVVNHGGYVTQPDNPTKKDYIFLGWFVDGEEFVFTDKIIEDTVLKARWQLDYVGALAALIAHYENTLGNMAWSPTADVELLAVINSAPITWTSSAPDYFSNTGKINIPTFTEGNQTIMLTAELSPVQSHVFFFIIEAAEQTTEELLIEILDTVTIVPVSTTGFQENNFEVTNSWKIGEEDVEITWQTSDATVMKANGELVSFEDAPSKEVTLKASITYNGVTKDKEILFVVKGVSTYSSFLEALVDANKGEKVKVEGVYLFTSISSTSTSSGYYLASADNMIAFVYGAIPSNLKVGKLYDVLFTVDIYYGSFQLNGVALIEERDGELPPVTPVEMTIEDVVNLPKPLDTSFNHTYLKLTNVEVRIDKNITDDRYNTFLVPQDLPADTPLTDQNSIMVYYVSDLDVIKALNGRRIDEILLINNGYRTNNLCWYVNYIGNGSDIVMGALSDAETVIEVKNQLASLVPHRILDAKGITLPVEREGSAIAWTSSHPEILAADGTVVLPAAGTEVTLTASITKGEAEAVYEKVVWVGTPESLTPDKTTDVIAYDGSFDLMPFKVVGVVTGATGNRSYTLQDASGAIGLYALTSQVLEYGYEYTIIGIKSVNQGINQLQNFTFVKGELKPLPDPVVLTEANLKDDKYMGTLRAHLVSFNDAEISKLVVDNYGTTEITLKLGTATVVMRWDNRVLITEESLAHLRGLNVGDKVNIVGAPVGWYNAPQLGYNDASQIQAISLESNEEKVAAAIAALDIPQNAKTDIVLPTTGRFDTNIVWASSNPEIIAVDGKITLPTENTFVTLTATVTAGEFTDTAEFVVYVQVDDTVMSIAIAFVQPVDTEVKFVGVVTGFTDYSEAFGNYDKVWLQDESGDILVYRGKFAADLAIGDKYSVAGKMAAYEGLIQVANSTVELIDRDNDLAEAVDVTDLSVLTEAYQAKRINLTGFVVSISSNGREMVVKVGANNITLRTNANEHVVNTHILTGEVGQIVNIIGVHVDWFKGVQLNPTLVSQIEFREVTNADKLQIDADDLEAQFNNKEFDMDIEIVLPLVGNQGSAIAWTIDPVDAIVDGKWFAVEKDTEVTLTATLTQGEETVEIVLKITVKALLEEQQAVLEYPAGGADTRNMGTENEAEAVHLDPQIFTVLGIKGTPSQNIALNWNGQIRIYSHRQSGNGNKLQVSIAEGGKITKIVIHFLKPAGSTAHSESGLLVLGTEEVVLVQADLLDVKTYEDLDVTTFSIENTHEGGTANGQIWIEKIEITYLGNFDETLEPDPDPDPEPETITSIADFMSLEQGETATIKGIITNVGPYNSFSIEDETGATAFRIGGKNSGSIDFKVGDEIQADVKKNAFNGLIQAEVVGAAYEILSSDNDLPALVNLNDEGLTAENLLQYQSRIVKLDNLEITNINTPSNAIELTLKRADGATIILRYDTRHALPDQNVISDFEIGDFVNINGATITWFNNPQLSIDNVNQVTLAVDS